MIVEINSCKNRCIFCNPRGSKRAISKDELQRIEAHLLAQAKGLEGRGFKEAEISGCDPIEYERIVPFIGRLKSDMGFARVRLLTHGRDLRRLRLVEELRDAGLGELRIPLYGSTAAIHDSITQEKGSFQDALEGIRNLAEHAPGIRLTITSLIMKQNYEDAVGIFSLASKHSSYILFSIPCVGSLEDGKRFVVSFDEMKPHLRFLIMASLVRLADEKPPSLKITDIPFCVFGFYRENIIARSGPPVTSEPYSLPERFRSDVPNLPSYRIKSKLAICGRCRFGHLCDGFYDNYTKLLDLSHLSPL
jgi:MoaA/NifB/PqqE/SkfB family radical SAM enzyme